MCIIEGQLLGRREVTLSDVGFQVQGLQGYLAHKKMPPPRTLLLAYA